MFPKSSVHGLEATHLSTQNKPNVEQRAETVADLIEGKQPFVLRH